jgi:hypothetical protein
VCSLQFHFTCQRSNKPNRVERDYNVIKGTEYFVSLKASIVITEEYNVRVNSEYLIGTTEYLGAAVAQLVEALC